MLPLAGIELGIHWPPGQFAADGTHDRARRVFWYGMNAKPDGQPCAANTHLGYKLCDRWSLTNDH
jgi:hypothetical protein